MRIEYVVPCKYAEVNDGLATIVGGGADTLAVPGYPADLQIMLAIRIIGEASEFPGEHHLSCPVRNSNDEVISDDLTAAFELGPSGAPHPGGEGWLHNIMLAAGVAFTAAEAGTYTVNVMFDDADYPVALYVVG